MVALRILDKLNELGIKVEVQGDRHILLKN